MWPKPRSMQFAPKDGSWIFICLLTCRDDRHPDHYFWVPGYWQQSGERWMTNSGMPVNNECQVVNWVPMTPSPDDLNADWEQVTGLLLSLSRFASRFATHSALDEDERDEIRSDCDHAVKLANGIREGKKEPELSAIKRQALLALSKLPRKQRKHIVAFMTALASD